MASNSLPPPTVALDPDTEGPNSNSLSSELVLALQLLFRSPILQRNPIFEVAGRLRVPLARSHLGARLGGTVLQEQEEKNSGVQVHPDLGVAGLQQVLRHLNVENVENLVETLEYLFSHAQFQDPAGHAKISRALAPFGPCIFCGSFLLSQDDISCDVVYRFANTNFVNAKVLFARSVIHDCYNIALKPNFTMLGLGIVSEDGEEHRTHQYAAIRQRLGIVEEDIVTACLQRRNIVARFVGPPVLQRYLDGETVSPGGTGPCSFVLYQLYFSLSILEEETARSQGSDGDTSRSTPSHSLLAHPGHSLYAGFFLQEKDARWYEEALQKPLSHFLHAFRDRTRKQMQAALKKQNIFEFLHQLLVLDLHQPSEKSAEILGDLSQVLTSSAERIRRALSQVRLLKSLYWNFRETHDDSLRSQLSAIHKAFSEELSFISHNAHILPFDVKGLWVLFDRHNHFLSTVDSTWSYYALQDLQDDLTWAKLLILEAGLSLSHNTMLDSALACCPSLQAISLELDPSPVSFFGIEHRIPYVDGDLMEERAAFFLKQEVVPVVMFEEGVWMEYALTHGLDALLRDLLVHVSETRSLRDNNFALAAEFLFYRAICHECQQGSSSAFFQRMKSIQPLPLGPSTRIHYLEANPEEEGEEDASLSVSCYGSKGSLRLCDQRLVGQYFVDCAPLFRPVLKTVGAVLVASCSSVRGSCAMQTSLTGQLGPLNVRQDLFVEGPTKPVAMEAAAAVYIDFLKSLLETQEHLVWKELKLGSASEEIANPVPRAGSEWWTLLRKKVSDEFSCGNFVQLQGNYLASEGFYDVAVYSGVHFQSLRDKKIERPRQFGNLLDDIFMVFASEDDCRTFEEKRFFADELEGVLVELQDQQEDLLGDGTLFEYYLLLCATAILKEDSRLLDCCLKVFVGTCHTTPILEVQQICSDLQLCLTGSPPFERYVRPLLQRLLSLGEEVIHNPANIVCTGSNAFFADNLLRLSTRMTDGLTKEVQHIVQSIFDVIYIQRTAALAVIHDSMQRFAL